METRTEALTTRRALLRSLGAALAAAPVVHLLGCSSTASAVATADTGTATDTGSTALDALADTTDVPWATGGTASMTAKASYPNPFASGKPTSCAVTCALTEGPCYDSASEVKQDISYGYTGLPMRMYIQILDESCNPVANATVDAWHTAAVGKYSGDDTAHEQVGFCTGNDTDFTSHLYFRGKQTTDANGIVYFDSCFPGWYSSRTIHIHFTISVGGTEYLTTQFCFDDALDDEIVASQPIYKRRGKRDTSNTTDSVFSASTEASYMFQTAKMSDGAMLAWKTIIVRSSLSTTLCGSGGGTMP